MRRWLIAFLVTFFAFAAFGQSPQTPRQALLEMLRANTPEQLDRHIPEALRQALAKLPPETREKERHALTMISMMMAMSPNGVQTFETGPVLAILQNPKSGEKVEILMERDELTGETDAMELGIRDYKEGKQREMPVDTHFLVHMKLENSVWKLSRVGISASLRLDDPKFDAEIVKAIQQQMARSGNGHIKVTGDASPEAAIVSLRTLNSAEIKYAAKYPSVGYTCKISDLGGSWTGKSADEHGAQLINPPLEGGVRSAYRFEISGCTGTTSYKIIAIPTARNLDRRMFCTDQSAVIRSVSEGSADCWSKGEPVN